MPFLATGLVFHPLQFLQHFIWPNSNKYYAPPVEFLQEYNSGNDGVNQMAASWFGYKNQKVKTRMKNNEVVVLDFYPILSGIINAVMLCILLCYGTLKGWKTNPVAKKGILLGSIVWLLNAGFTISASSAALRFQSFPIMLTTVFVALLVEWLWKTAMNTEVANLNQQMSKQPTALAENILA